MINQHTLPVTFIKSATETNRQANSFRFPLFLQPKHRFILILIMPYTPLTILAQQRINRIIKAGDTCIDATMGNGHDTLFLAQSVGTTGRVYAFDIQNTAVEATRVLLIHNQLQSRVNVIKASHQVMQDYITDPVKAIMFNLGYLPGGNKSIITRTTNTLAALNASIKLLTTPGCLTIIAYPGHAGGEDEAATIKDWTKHLPDNHFQIEYIYPQSSRNRAPELTIITRC